MYQLITEHSDGVHTQSFSTYEAAAAYAEATSPDIDGSLLPNVSDAAMAPYGGVKSEHYSRGFFWLRTNRYAALFTTEVPS